MSSPQSRGYVVQTEKNQDLISRAKALNHVPWCEEYEEMISGMKVRFMGVPILEAKYKQTRRLCREFNAFVDPEDATLTEMKGQAHAGIAAIVGHLGERSFVARPFRTSIGCNIWIGDEVGINEELVNRIVVRDCLMAKSLYSLRAADIGLITIRDRTIIGGNCRIETVNHSLNYVDRYRCRPDGTARPVEIGEDCWLGARVTVLPGVTIGKGCVVAAGAVVAKDVAPFNLVGGVPAKVIRYLGDPKELESQGDKSNGTASGDGGDIDFKTREESRQQKSEEGLLKEDVVVNGNNESILIEKEEVFSQGGKGSEEGLPDGRSAKEINKPEPELPRGLQESVDLI